MFKSNSIKLILAGASSIAILSSTSAHAQLDEIIVTAEKRAENVQDVSISVTALNEELLELGGIDDVSRLELLVPGVNFSFAGNDAKFNVRGANSTNTFGDNSSIVGAFVDGVYKARASQQTRAFFDVGSVEFLRGPQGTLYGRNTFAGALNLHTNNAELEEYSAGVDLSYQRFDRARAEGFINVPIGDKVAIRAAGFFDKSDGYIENLAGPDLGANDDKGFRISLHAAPTDAFQATLRYSHISEDGNEAGLFGYTRLCRNETPEGLTDPLGSVSDCTNPVRGSGGLGIAANDPNGGDPYVVSQDYVRPVDLYEDVLSLTLDYDLGFAAVKSITSYTDFVNDIQFDFDFSPTPNSNGGFEEETQGWTQELQLVSQHEGPLQYTVGGYYSDQDDRFSFNIYQQTQRDDSTRGSVTNAQGTFTLLDSTNIVSLDTNLGGFFADNAVINTQYLGIFGQVEYSFAESLRVIGGLRYNDESKDLTCGGSNFTGDLNGDGTVDRVVNVAPGVAGSSPAVIPRGEDVFTFNCDAADQVEVSDSYDNVTWRAGVEYDLSDDILLYASGSTGYLSGAVSTGGSTDEQESQVIELGFRSRLADNTVQLNGAIHFTEYTNLLTQIQTIDPNTGVAITTSENGGDIDAWGIEVDAIWQPTEQLTLSANATYLNSEFGTFGQSNPYQLFNGTVQSFIDQAGNTTPWSPEFTLAASAAYTIDLAEGLGTLTPYGQFYYSDGFNTSNLLANDPAQFQDSFTKTDLRLIWDDESGKYAVEVFGENLEGSAVLARGNNNGDDVVQTSFLYPSNYGVKFKARF